MKKLAAFKTLFLYIAIVLSAAAQQPYFSYRTLTKREQLSFPVFDSKTNAKAVTNINRLLQVKELQVLDGY